MISWLREPHGDELDGAKKRSEGEEERKKKQRKS